MRLRKECEHRRYDAHDFTIRGAATCPGGEFLPEGALVIEPGSSPEEIMRWFLDHGFETHDCATYSETSLILRARDNARLKCEWVLPASQVGESE